MTPYGFFAAKEKEGGAEREKSERGCYGHSAWGSYCARSVNLSRSKV